MPWIATAVAALQYLVEAVHHIMFGEIAGSFETLEQVVALDVHVGGRNVGDLAGRVAQADPLVIDGRPDPDRAAVIHLVRFPEADVMPVPRVVANRMFERQVLLPPKEIETTDWGVIIRA